jgi:hypothetical protein
VAGESGNIDVAQAEEILRESLRFECRDHAFGDAEITWQNAQEVEVAGGYFSSSGGSIWLLDGEGNTLADYDGEDAQRLRQLGQLQGVSRNDSTGPEEYSEGTIMPGLTFEAVLNELVNPTKE